MCGIVGLICQSQYGFDKKHEDVFFQLLKVDELRGDDSTGIIYAESDGGFGYLKEASCASWVGSTMYAHPMMKASMQRGKAYIGHNRKATIGKVKDETAHPFVVDDNFAMVHNGTLFNHNKLKQTEVDSEALAHHLKPILTGNLSDDQLNEEMGKIDGAYAVAAYSQEKHQVYLVRNAQRPLALVELPNGYAWASEGLMLAWILSRNGYDLSKCNGRDIKEHTIIIIDLKTNKLTEREYQPKKAMVVVTPTKVSSTNHSSTTTTTNGGSASKAPATFQEPAYTKAAFKRLRAKYINTRHTFWADDYVEKFFPRTLEDGETIVNLLGEFDGDWCAGVPIALNAEVDLSKVEGLVSFEDKEITDRCWSGRIANMVFDKERKTVLVFLDDIKVVTKSYLPSVPAILQVSADKWAAIQPSNVDVSELLTKHPNELSAEEWKKVSITHYWSAYSTKWLMKNETSSTLH